MKRRGFLKKMIGALCAAGILISIPITANAADKKDVLGDWYGPFPYNPVKFYEDGTAQDYFNTRAYTMESGSLTVTYDKSGGTGETVTVDYDLWRGEKIKDVPVDEKVDAVIYKIVAPGEMQLWNVSKPAGQEYWSSYLPVTIYKKTESKAEAPKAWKPTTPDELKLYAVFSQEEVNFTTDAKNSYAVNIYNALQGPLCLDSFEAVLDDYTIGRTYNIIPSDEVTYQIYQMDSKARITLEIPTAFQKADRDLKMICVTENGRPIVLEDLDSDQNTITFETDTYFAYALIYKDI